MKSSELPKEGYWKALNNKSLSRESLNKLLPLFEKRHLKIEKIPEDVINHPRQVTEFLSRLELYVVKGNSSWEGLVVGFPGSQEELATSHISTPYLRKILYPILELHKRLREKTSAPMPCLYLLGERFSDVVLRKFRLLNTVIPHVIVLTSDLMSRIGTFPSRPLKMKSEEMLKFLLCEAMFHNEGLVLPVESGSRSFGYVSHEVPAYEGTQDPERLDILGYDKKDCALVAFEIKGPTCNKLELENLFLQGMEHRNWLEENKMVVKFIFGGPRCKTINTRKRVRLMLGFCGDHIPSLFDDLKRQVEKDKYLKVNFYSFLSPESGKLELISALY